MEVLWRNNQSQLPKEQECWVCVMRVGSIDACCLWKTIEISRLWENSVIVKNTAGINNNENNKKMIYFIKKKGGTESNLDANMFPAVI